MSETNVDVFLSNLVENFDYNRHIDFPNIQKEANYFVRKKKIPIPYAFFMVFQKYPYGISLPKYSKQFSIKPKKLAKYWEQTGKQRPNSNESVINELEREKILDKKNAEETLTKLNEITHGNTTYESIAGLYLILKNTNQRLSYKKLIDTFKITSASIKNNIDRIRLNNPDYFGIEPPPTYKNIVEEFEKSEDFLELINKHGLKKLRKETPEDVFENRFKKEITESFENGWGMRRIFCRYQISKDESEKYITKKDREKRAVRMFEEEGISIRSAALRNELNLGDVELGITKEVIEENIINMYKEFENELTLNESEEDRYNIIVAEISKKIGLSQKKIRNHLSLLLLKE